MLTMHGIPKQNTIFTNENHLRANWVNEPDWRGHEASGDEYGGNEPVNKIRVIKKLHVTVNDFTSGLASVSVWP